MTRNQASGGDSVSSPRSQVRRQSAAETTWRTPELERLASGPEASLPGRGVLPGSRLPTPAAADQPII